MSSVSSTANVVPSRKVPHYLWLVKVDVQPPLMYGAVLAVLLGARVWFRFAKKRSLWTKQPADIIKKAVRR